jgi:hypothetical protein
MWPLALCVVGGEKRGEGEKKRVEGEGIKMICTPSLITITSHSLSHPTLTTYLCKSNMSCRSTDFISISEVLRIVLDR